MPSSVDVRGQRRESARQRYCQPPGQTTGRVRGNGQRSHQRLGPTGLTVNVRCPRSSARLSLDPGPIASDTLSPLSARSEMRAWSRASTSPAAWAPISRADALMCARRTSNSRIPAVVTRAPLQAKTQGVDLASETGVAGQKPGRGQGFGVGEQIIFWGAYQHSCQFGHDSAPKR